MFRNYIVVAARHLIKHKGFSLINVAGLALGIACCLLILLFVRHELSYDRFHEHYERTYRIAEVFTENGVVVEESASVPFPVAGALETDFPGLKAVRFFRIFQQIPLIRSEDREFYEADFFFADSTFNDVFSFPLVQGDPATSLDQPFSVLITEAMAVKYFGERDPLGQTLSMENQLDFTVTGVLRDLPENTHFSFDFIASFSSVESVLGVVGGFGNIRTNWYWNPCYTYLLLPEGMSQDAFEAQMPGFIQKNYPEWLRASISHYTQPITDIHLTSHLYNEISTNGNSASVYIFSAIAALILLIACINFMNLSTARSSQRGKEIGMRKVLGAHRSQLAGQFLGESILVSLLATVSAAFLMAFLLPVFNTLAGTTFTLSALQDGFIIAGLIGLSMLVGVLAGGYPALLLSGFRPLEVLKGSVSFGTSRRSLPLLLRRGLVVLQFSISIGLLAGTGIILYQLDYLQSADLGFEQEQVVILPIRGTPIKDNTESFKQALLANPQIVSVSATSEVLGKLGGTQIKPFRMEGHEDPLQWPGIFADHDYLQTLGVEIVQGRDFSKDFPTDATEGYILNETAVRALGWEDDPIGKRIEVVRQPGRVIGVMKDFNFLSLHHAIDPLVLHIVPRWFDYVAIRLRPDDLPNTLAFLDKQWSMFAPNRPLDYFFLDAHFEQLYASETRLRNLISVFATLAVLIACLGLFGLASFTAERRTKEIGIRKTMGASAWGIVRLLAQDIVKLVAVAFVLAAPLVYMGMARWLQAFAYRVEVPLGLLLLAGFAALAIAFLTVSYQTLRAAYTNPVHSLRHE